MPPAAVYAPVHAGHPAMFHAVTADRAQRRLGNRVSLVELTSARYLIARVARVTGHVLWWVFVVAQLISEMTSFGLPRRYADYDESIFGVGLGQGDSGWAPYVLVTDGPPSGLSDPFYNANIIATVAAVALAVTMLAAVVEAVAVRRWRAGVATILTPVVGAGVILSALYYRSGAALNLVAVLVLVLFGIGIREVWSRVWAPLTSRSRPDAPRRMRLT
ncbi:Uncharacterised protein [Mycolicibacterium phlei]|nr:Uncharacterised protein [Mycolicibacterium phlei]